MTNVQFVNSRHQDQGNAPQQNMAMQLMGRDNKLPDYFAQQGGGGGDSGGMFGLGGMMGGMMGGGGGGGMSMPDMGSGWQSTVLPIAGSIIGGYFGGPVGASLGSSAGKYLASSMEAEHQAKKAGPNVGQQYTY